MVIRPGSPVARSTGCCRVPLGFQPDDRPPPPTHVQQKPKLLAKGGIETAVDERVVTSGAHSQPVKAEVKGVGGVDGLAGQQHHVAVEGKPAHSKHSDHQQQHGQSPPALFSLGGVLSCCGVTDGIVAPQPASDCGVGDGDDEERQHVKQNEGQKVNILPVDIRRLWEVWDTQAALLLPTCEKKYSTKDTKHENRLVSRKGITHINMRQHRKYLMFNLFSPTTKPHLLKQQ